MSRKDSLKSGTNQNAAERSEAESPPLPPPLPGGKGGLTVPSTPITPGSRSDGQSGGRDARSLTARGATNAPVAEKAKGRGRFSAPRKTEAIKRLFRGEALDTLSRELGVTAATLSEWREKFLAGGEAALKAREGSAQDDEVRQLKAMLGDVTMRLEISREAVTRLSGGRPFVPWRSRK